jgi:hypothetical protein
MANIAAALQGLVSAANSQGAALHGATGAAGHSPAAPASPKKRNSDQRFRSFAERYLVARAQFFRQDPKGLAEDTWSCILDAERAYRMIERTGQHINPEDGVF